MIAAVLALVLTALAAPSAASPPDATAEPVWSGPAACRFVAPLALGEGRVEWTGSCARGTAQGLGMLRPRGSGAADIAFFGTLENGRPVSGVIDYGVGYTAGRFTDGDIVAASEMDARDAAFDVAARAAEAVSRHYRARGNVASARFYAAKAATLLRQIE